MFQPRLTLVRLLETAEKFDCEPRLAISNWHQAVGSWSDTSTQ